MRGRVCIVTGATSGIGKATAAALAARGAHVVMVGRDRQRGEAARQSILDRVGSSAAVDLLLADLSSLAAVRGLARDIAAGYPAIHVLLNNAGLFPAARVATVDGVESTFAVNHLSYFLLTSLLLDRLRAGAPSRVVNVASEAHKKATGFTLTDLELEQGWSPKRAYATSKLANILFTYELARRLEGSGVTANCLHPGVVRTGLLAGYVRSAGPLAVLVKPLLDLFFIDEEAGARTSVHVATAPELERVTGKYFKREREAKSSRRSYDRELQRGLWERSEERVGAGRS